MSEWRFKGYGRSWTEEKALGVARLLQIMREPATTTSLYVTFGLVIAIEIAALSIFGLQ